MGVCTRLWAASAELPDLQQALRAGRAWAYKPDSWNGTLRTTAGDSPALGAVVAAGRPVPVTVTATELPRDGTLEVVTGRADRAAPVPAIRSAAAPGGTHTADLAPGSYVRAVVRDAGGRIVGVGNPTWVVRDHAGIPAERRRTV